MARNLTEQVRGIATVVTAVANGDLDRKLNLAARGEIATLVDTINNMIDTLSTFAEQVTGVARDVGVDGRLGGQADVPGAAGVWRDLTNNVNELAGNLTNQVRAIRDVATAVTQGDLTRSITVEARGEIAQLKDTVNQMIRTLAETTKVNQEQDWLKTNVARFTRMLQGQRDLLTVARQILNELAPLVNAHHGAFYMTESDDEGQVLRLFATLRVPGAQEHRERRGGSARASSVRRRSKASASCYQQGPGRLHPDHERARRERRRTRSSSSRSCSRARSRASSSSRRSSGSVASSSRSSTRCSSRSAS